MTLTHRGRARHGGRGPSRHGARRAAHPRGLRRPAGAAAPAGPARTVADEALAMRGMLDALPHPMWLRDPDGRLTWVNAAYARAVEAPNGARGGDTGRSNSSTAPFARNRAAQPAPATASIRGRVPAVVAGERRMLRRHGPRTQQGSVGIATDVSEFENAARRVEGVEPEPRRHARPAAHRGRDLRRRASVCKFCNAAYRELWQLDPAFLETLADRRRDPRSPAQRAPAARAGRLPRLEEPACWTPTARSSPRRRPGTCRTAGRCASSPTRIRTAASPISSTTSPSASISKRSSTPCMRRAGRDAGHAQGRRRGVRHRRPPEAAQPRLRQHCGARRTACSKDGRISRPIIERARELHPDEAAWQQMRGAVTGLSDVARELRDPHGAARRRGARLRRRAAAGRRDARSPSST